MKDAPSAVPPPASLRSAPSQATSLRSAKPAWHRAARPGTTTEARQRILVFVAGGMTYSEVREVYQLSHSLGKDIYIGSIISELSRTSYLASFIGSTHTVTPRHFIDDLKVLDLGGVGSRAIPNGVAEGRGGQRPFQEYYDDKYFTKDAPPPQRPPATSLPVPREDRNGKSSGISPTSSFAGSFASLTPSAKDGKEKKEKKKGLFRF